MPIQAGLVTLSACRTAGARAYSGRAAGSLGRPFFRSRNVVAAVAGLRPCHPPTDGGPLRGMRRGLSRLALREAKPRHAPLPGRLPRALLLAPSRFTCAQRF